MLVRSMTDLLCPLPVSSWRRAPAWHPWVWCLCCSTSSAKGSPDWRTPSRTAASLKRWSSPWCPAPSASSSITTDQNTPRWWKRWAGRASRPGRGSVSVFERCPQVGLGVLTISSIVVSVLSAMAVKDVLWMIAMPDILLVAALMPLIGFMLGYFMSVACRLSAQWVHLNLGAPNFNAAAPIKPRPLCRCSRTISMETGCQNIQLCIVILKVAFPPEVIGPMFLFPLIYIAAQCTEAVLLALCYRCYLTVRQRVEGKGHSWARVCAEHSCPFCVWGDWWRHFPVQTDARATTKREVRTKVVTPHGDLCLAANPLFVIYSKSTLSKEKSILFVISV